MTNTIQHRSNHGFSLIELLVTVAILGILASISIAQYSEYRKRAYDTVAINDLRNFISSSYAYCANNPADLPDMGGVPTPTGCFSNTGTNDDCPELASAGLSWSGESAFVFYFHCSSGYAGGHTHASVRPETQCYSGTTGFHYTTGDSSLIGSCPPEHKITACHDVIASYEAC